MPYLNGTYQDCENNELFEDLPEMLKMKTHNFVLKGTWNAQYFSRKIYQVFLRFCLFLHSFLVTRVYASCLCGVYMFYV